MGCRCVVAPTPLGHRASQPTNQPTNLHVKQVPDTEPVWFRGQMWADADIGHLRKVGALGEYGDPVI